MLELGSDLVWSALQNAGSAFAAVLPSVLAMLTLLVLGAVLGALAGGLLARLTRAIRLDDRGAAWGLTSLFDRAGIGRPPSQVVRLLVFWGTLLVFATLGIDALAIPGAPAASGLVLRFLPRILSAALILVVGVLAANFVGQAVLIAVVNANIPGARLLARVTRWAILFFAVATAMTELGIGRDMIVVAFSVTFGGLVLALALAFGLGGRDLARDVLERRFGRRQAPEPKETVTHL